LGHSPKENPEDEVIAKKLGKKVSLHAMNLMIYLIKKILKTRFSRN